MVANKRETEQHNRTEEKSIVNGWKSGKNRWIGKEECRKMHEKDGWLAELQRRCGRNCAK